MNFNKGLIQGLIAATLWANNKTTLPDTLYILLIDYISTVTEVFCFSFLISSVFSGCKDDGW